MTNDRHGSRPVQVVVTGPPGDVDRVQGLIAAALRTNGWSPPQPKPPRHLRVIAASGEQQ
jgi:hypothetical protein